MFTSIIYLYPLTKLFNFIFQLLTWLARKKNVLQNEAFLTHEAFRMYYCANKLIKIIILSNIYLFMHYHYSILFIDLY